MLPTTRFKQILLESTNFVLANVSAKALLQKHADSIWSHPVFAETHLDNPNAQPIHVVAIGKMADALVLEFSQMFKDFRLKGVVSSPYESDVPRVDGMKYFRGGHPVPNKHSVASALAALEMVASVQTDAPVVYLISGGGSACFESPDLELGAMLFIGHNQNQSITILAQGYFFAVGKTQ